MSVTLYGVTRSRASRVVWLCLEAGITFEQVPVIQARRLADPVAAEAPLNTRSPAFLAINPAGLVPALRDGDLILHESLAINLHLARKAGPPIGPADPAEDGRMLAWSFWAATEIEPLAFEILQHRANLPKAEQVAERAKAAAEKLRPKLAMLDAALRAHPWLVGERFTVADINAAEILRYATHEPGLFDTIPDVHRWYRDCQSRPAFLEMMRRRDAEPA